MTTLDLVKYSKTEICDMVDNFCTAGDGAPILCYHCGGTKFKDDIDFSYGMTFISEYSMMCCSCERIVGYWAYGYWQR